MPQAKNDNIAPAALAVPDAFVLPPFELPSWLPGRTGMTSRQSALAFREIRCDDAMFKECCALSSRIQAAEKELEALLGEERELFLRAMWRRYPAAARRIIAKLRDPRGWPARPPRR